MIKKLIILLCVGSMLGGCSLTSKTQDIQGNVNNTGDNTTKSNEAQTCKIDNLNDCVDDKYAE